MSVRKKGNKWYCRFQIDGIRYERPCKGASDEKSALKCETIIKAEIMHGNYNFGKSEILPRFSEAIELIKIHSKNNKRSYKTDLGRISLLEEYFKNKPLKEFSPKVIEEFKTYLKFEKNLSNATINRYVSLIRKTFTLCIKNKLIIDNPCSGVSKLRENNFKIRYLTKPEEKRLFEVIKDENFANLVKLALWTGMRKQEVLNLKWENIDKNTIEILETKSGKSRKIPNVGKLKNLLESIPKDNEYVFYNKKTKTKYTDVLKRFANYLGIAQIKNFRFHDLRHTAATRMVEKGVDLVVIQQLLGHASITTTMRYAHALEEMKVRAIEVLSDY